jgi:hypothetical protein
VLDPPANNVITQASGAKQTVTNLAVAIGNSIQLVGDQNTIKGFQILRIVMLYARLMLGPTLCNGCVPCQAQ